MCCIVLHLQKDFSSVIYMMFKKKKVPNGVFLYLKCQSTMLKLLNLWHCSIMIDILIY